MTYHPAQLEQLTRRTTMCAVIGQVAVWQKLCQTMTLCMDRQIHAFPGGVSVGEVRD